MSGLVVVPRQRPLDLWPPVASTFREPELLPVVRVEPCACGERIRQLAGDDIATTVAGHQSTPAHRAWRERTGL